MQRIDEYGDRLEALESHIDLKVTELQAHIDEKVADLQSQIDQGANERARLQRQMDEQGQILLGIVDGQANRFKKLSVQDPKLVPKTEGEDSVPLAETELDWMDLPENSDFHRILAKQDMAEKIVGRDLTVEDFRTLRPGKWLSATVIQHFFRSLTERQRFLSQSLSGTQQDQPQGSYYFSPFLMTKLLSRPESHAQYVRDEYNYENVRRWTKANPKSKWC